MFFGQSHYSVRCEWGPAGLREIAPAADVVIIVDVLSFSTSVDIAVGRGAVVFPFPSKGAAATEYAASHDAVLAAAKRGEGWSLSPQSLLDVPKGARLVLPSPNGSALAYAAEHACVLAACLRNASAVARYAATRGQTFAVIPSGELWDTGELRPCLADWLGAGAVIGALPGTRSREAHAAETVFQSLRCDLGAAMRECGSGRELIDRGFDRDVELAADLDASETVPLRGEDGAFRAETAK